MLSKIQWRQDTALNWTNENTVLGTGEAGVELDSPNPKKWKLGDGTTPWNSLPYMASGGGSSAPVISGSRSAPTDITAVGGVTALSGYNQLIYIQGAAGPVAISANPQVSPGANDGELLELRGRSNTNTVKVANGNGLSLNGTCNLGQDWSLTLRWDTANWVEVSRRENS